MKRNQRGKFDDNQSGGRDGCACRPFRLDPLGILAKDVLTIDLSTCYHVVETAQVCSPIRQHGKAFLEKTPVSVKVERDVPVKKFRTRQTPLSLLVTKQVGSERPAASVTENAGKQWHRAKLP